MNKHNNVLGLFLVYIFLVCEPAFGQVAGKTFEPGVFRGTLFNGSPVLVAIDESQKIGYASLRATLSCIEDVQVFVGSGNASIESSISITSTIDARCPDKSVISFDIRMVYDFATDTMELSYPEFPTWTPATLGRLGFNPSVFTSAIQEMKNDSTWVAVNLFTQIALDDLEYRLRWSDDYLLDRIYDLEREVRRLGSFH